MQAAPLMYPRLRRILPLALLATLSPALFADSTCVPQTANSGNKTIVTASCSETQVVTSTTAQAATNSYLTTITAEIGSSTYLFDQTFNAPYSDASVQAAVVTAENDLLSAGASGYTGPSLTASSTSTSVSSSMAVLSSVLDPAGTGVVGTTTTYGSGAILTGEVGLCAGLQPDGNGSFVPFGCSGGTLVPVYAGQTDININTNNQYDVTALTTVTTNTSLSQTYNLNGTLSGPVTSPVPEPSTLALFGTGTLGLLGAARRRLNR